jgi:hypothetical protein
VVLAVAQLALLVWGRFVDSEAFPFWLWLVFFVLTSAALVGAVAAVIIGIAERNVDG